jgi:murein DD-endopeptidase MepM/ murein hydrolase activator NlpD
MTLGAWPRRHIAALSSMACALLAACEVGEALRGRVRVLTPHDQYAQALTRAGLDSTALGAEWLRASDSALRAPLPSPVPFREVGFYSRSEARALAFRFALTEGQVVQASLQLEGLPARVFLDLFEERRDTAWSAEHRSTARRDSADVLVLRHEIQRSGAYLLRLQPELLRDGRFVLTVTSGPVLAFPVEGHGNAAVQSLFGVDRDAGRRRHEGIDIFAPRGTPVVASTDGVVRSTSPNELGGNVVWLADDRRHQSLYYAHLESHAVVAGQGVRAGDTLGFVGNSGNARSTKPHLHFGIYRRGEGAIDPWPWVRRPTTAADVVVADTARLGTVAAVTTRLALLRRWAAVRADSVRSLPAATPVLIAGAQGVWYRVQLASGETGYLVPGSVARRLSVRHPVDALIAAARIDSTATGRGRGAPSP